MTKAEAVIIKEAMCQIELTCRRLDKKEESLPPGATAEEIVAYRQMQADHSVRHGWMHLLTQAADATLKEAPGVRVSVDEV